IMKEYNRMVPAGVLVEDSVSGRVRLAPGGRPVAMYQLSERDIRQFVRGTALLSELLFAAGARKIYLPFEGVPPLTSSDDVKELRSRKIEKWSIEVGTVHIMGTAAIGGDERRHVCDSFGQVYGTKGLHVADASMFPSPVGVNPMGTIMALATRNAEWILETGV
ncbi:MAG: GMC family oxidoreductase, partial [Pseudomonadota bacterium]